MRALVTIVALACSIGCSGASWLPSVKVSAETSRDARESVGLADRRTADRWHHRLGVALWWSEDGERGDAQAPLALGRRDLRDLRARPHDRRRPACRAEELCRWERAARVHALGVLVDEGGGR